MVEPVLLYGTLVWWTVCNYQCHCRMINKVRRWSAGPSTNDPACIINWLPSDLLVKRRIQMFSGRLNASARWPDILLFWWKIYESFKRWSWSYRKRHNSLWVAKLILPVFECRKFLTEISGHTKVTLTWLLRHRQLHFGCTLTIWVLRLPLLDWALFSPFFEVSVWVIARIFQDYLTLK